MRFACSKRALRMALDGAGDPYFSTPLSKILTGTPPECGFWKGPGQDL